MVESKSIASRIATAINYLVLILFAAVCIIPFLYVLSSSFTPSAELLIRRFALFPRSPTLEAYQFVFTTDIVLGSMLNSVYVTVVGTALNLALIILLAYPLSHSKRELPGRKIIMSLIVFTLLFDGGIIPRYIVVKSLGLLDTFWAVILPGVISVFNLIILRNFFQQLPPSLEESAKLDGCSDLRCLISIVLPLSLPAIATIGLFCSVNHWNAFFEPLLFLNKSEKWTIQIILRQFIIIASGNTVGNTVSMDESFVIPKQSVKMAIIVISMTPIMCVYPFVLKFFKQGIMIGSIKG